MRDEMMESPNKTTANTLRKSERGEDLHRVDAHPRVRELAAEIGVLLGGSILTGHVEIHYRKGCPTRVWSNRLEMEF